MERNTTQLSGIFESINNNIDNSNNIFQLYNNTSSFLSPRNTGIDYCVLPRKPIRTAIFSCLLVFIPVTVIGNFLVAFIILTTSSLRRQTTFLFLASLAITDTLIGLITMPINAKQQWNSERFCMPKTVCWIYLFTEPILSISSVLHLFIISIDRYVSLKYVYDYQRWMTQRRVLYVILTIWMLVIMLSTSNTLKWQSDSPVRWSYRFSEKRRICTGDNPSFYTMMYVGCFGVPLIIMLYTYSYVYQTAMRHIKEISRTEVSMMNICDEESCERRRERKLKERQFRTLRSIVIVFIVFFVCWFPTIVYILSIFYVKNFWQQFRREQWFIAMHFILIHLLPPLNSTTNPFIYVLSNRQFRNIVKQLFWKLSGNKEHALFYMNSVFSMRASPNTRRKSEQTSQQMTDSNMNLKKSDTVESSLSCGKSIDKDSTLMVSTL